MHARGPTRHGAPIESGDSGSGGAVEPAAAATPAVYEPVDLEELGVTRRQFFNRSILAGTGLGLGAFGVASLAFLWPSSGGGFGGKVTVGSVADVEAAFDNKIPFYNAGAKTYIVAYPKDDLPKAKKVAAYDQVDLGDGAGLRRAVPEVRAPRLPGAVVPELAVVRVPVPRLEVQPGR